VPISPSSTTFLSNVFTMPAGTSRLSDTLNIEAKKYEGRRGPH